ncbi:TIGR01621 family pseudouridine synthase [Thalassotalea mangrovi]|nr:TIGR01621 family pseudouridine synthase [Thalassotalea mangrovi]
MNLEPLPAPLFEHPDFIVVNKPSGVNFHDEDALGQGFFNRYKAIYDELYPLHRLDKMTSGVMLMARNSASVQHLSRLFAERKVDKTYIALARGKPKKKQGWIKGDMAKSRRGSFKLLRSMDNPAITQFESYSLGDGVRFFKLMPKTGKTHQLRVAMNSLGTAIIGDPIYGSDSAADRGYLHAFQIRFELNDIAYKFVADVPTKDGELFAKYQQQIRELLNSDK